jgi:hypothetical protein
MCSVTPEVLLLTSSQTYTSLSPLESEMRRRFWCCEDGRRLLSLDDYGNVNLPRNMCVLTVLESPSLTADRGQRRRVLRRERIQRAAPRGTVAPCWFRIQLLSVAQ